MDTKEIKGIDCGALDNEGYIDDDYGNAPSAMFEKKSTNGDIKGFANGKDGWNSSIEFLMSCVALSVGFGNVWRFPLTAYENGGGAFLIPYIILLILVGKPFYYLEMIIGQFSSRSSIKVWSVSPGFAGIGWAQMCSTICAASYYCCLMAFTLLYLISSFAEELPWSRCNDDWGDRCIDSGKHGLANRTLSQVHDRPDKHGISKKTSSAELYFLREVLKEKDSINDGIGMPDLKLTLCLFVCWVSICLVLSRGIKSTGKASYFLAIFPYTILLCLLARAVTLNGAIDGIIFFITPVWSKLLDPNVWYAAVTQCFFSLSVCFGAIITVKTEFVTYHI